MKSGFVWKKRLFPTTAGTPQGGNVSPTIVNMTLDGMETMLRQHFGVRGVAEPKRTRSTWWYTPMIFVAIGANKDVVEEAKSLIEIFLKERGLSLSPEKTRIVHIDEGFDFLGWNLRKYGGKLADHTRQEERAGAFAKNSGNYQRAEGSEAGRGDQPAQPIIRGWANYHQNQVATKTFKKVDHLIWRRLWRWACRRHPKKSKTWIKKRYLLTEGIRNWVFGTKVNGADGKVKRAKLAHASDTPIRRHIKIKGGAKPFDPPGSLTSNKGSA